MTLTVNARIAAESLPHDSEAKRSLARELLSGLIFAKLSTWGRVQAKDAAESGREALDKLNR
jgi:hypothetical protein